MPLKVNELLQVIRQRTLCHDDGQCPSCDKPGQLLVAPLLYAAFCTDDVFAKTAVPPLPPGPDSPPLEHAQYALRMVREGYLYVLVVRKGGAPTWQGYYCVPSGHLHSFPVSDPPPRQEGDIACARMAESTEAMLVGIERPDEVEQTYWLFTPDPLSDAKLDEYRDNAERFASEGKLQTFSPKHWLGSQQADEPYVMSSATMQAFTLELAAAIPGDDKPQVAAHALATELDRQPFPALRKPAQLAEHEWMPTVTLAAARLGTLKPALDRSRGAAIALYDPIGITQTLNAWRNAALEGMSAWMEEQDKQEISNAWKFNVATQLQDVREGIREARIQAVDRHWDSLNAETFEEAAYYQYPDPYRRQRETYRREAIERDGHETRQTQLAIARMFPDHNKRDRDAWLEQQRRGQRAPWEGQIGREKQAAGETALERYERRLDFDAADAQVEAFNARAAPCQTMMQHRVQDHLGWLQSTAILHALHAYDQTDDLHGWAFAQQVATATMGMDASEEGQAVLLTWWKDMSIAEGSLMWRVYALNRTDLLDTTREAFGELRAQHVTTLQGMQPGDVPAAAKKAVSQAKKLIDAFDKAAKSLDDTEQGLTPVQWLARSDMAPLLGWYGQMARALFSFSLPNTLDRGMAYVMSTALEWRLGRFAANLHMQNLAAAGMTADFMRVQGMMRRHIRDNITAELKAGKLGNFWALRVGVVMAMLEGAILLQRASSMPERTEAWMRLAGSALAMTGAFLLLLQTGAEWITKREGRLTGLGQGSVMWSGGLRLHGALLGTAGGVMVAALGIRKGTQEIEKGHFWLGRAYQTQSIGVAALSSLQTGIALSASGPYLKEVIHRTENRLVLALLRGAEKISRLLAADAVLVRMRYLLSRTLWAVMVVEGVIWLLTPDEMETWCDKSVFRIEKKGRGFGNEAEELRELDYAFAMLLRR